MKKLIEKTMQIYKKSFTLIELIVVIVVIGILAAIVIPNISSFKEEASVTAMVADGKNLQTAVDLYQLDHHGVFPTLNDEKDSIKPVLGLPQSVDFNALYPAYIRDLPQAKKMYYWIDYQGQFYYSTIDNPDDFVQGDSGLTWTANEKAAGYKIHEVESNTTGSSKNVTLAVVGELSGGVDSFIPDNYSKENFYFINAIDEYGNEAPPVKSEYIGVTPLQPSDIVKDTLPKEDRDEEENSATPIPPIISPEQEELWEDPTNKMVAAGSGHSMVIDEDGNLWSFGLNNYGQLGHSENTGDHIPNPVPQKIMSNVRYVSTGSYHTLVIKENDELWAFGYNYYGQLGHSKNVNNHVANPVPEMIMSDVKSVSGGYQHSLVVKNNGELWSFGQNRQGQSGDLTTASAYKPTNIMSGIKSASAGYNFSLALTEMGEVYSFGINNYGQLGHSENVGTTTRNPTPKMILTGIKSISAGYRHSFAVSHNGELWSFGSNSYGQLGDDAITSISSTPKQTMSGVHSASAGTYFSLVLKTDNSLWSFGNNSSGELGHVENSGINMANPTPKQIGLNIASYSASSGSHSMIMNKQGEVQTFGRNRYGALGIVKNSGFDVPNPIPSQIELIE